MAISLTQLVQQGVRTYDAVAALEQCSDCGKPLQETIHGYRRTKGGPKCSDCYFDSLSRLIDEHPIGRPMAVRGTAV